MSVRKGIPVPAKRLGAMVARLFVASGFPENAAQRLASGLVEAELEGISSHGLSLVDMYVARIRSGSVSCGLEGRIVSDRGTSVVLDAGHALGLLTGDQAMSLAVERARTFGAGIVAVRHGFHFGAAKRFALQAAGADCIGIAMCNTRPLMPAPGGSERIVGNNPVAIAIPADGPIPIVLDMATSEAAMGKIRMAEKAGQPIPANWAVRSDGTPTTNAAEAVAGMLLPSGGAKGFGLAFVIDLMCGLLSGGASGEAVRPLYGDMKIPYDCSHLFIAIDVAHFVNPAVFRAQAAAAAARVRNGGRAPGVSQIFTPGEPEWQRAQAAAGTVTLDPAVADALLRLAGDLKVSPDPLAPDHNSVTQESGHAKA